MKRILQIAQLALLVLAAVGLAHAQGSVQIIDSTGTGVTVTPSCVVNHNCLDVNIASGGGSGGTSSSFGAAFPATGTAIGVKNGSNMVNLAADGSSNLLVNCAVGCSASAGFADNSAFTAGSTAFSPVGGWYTTSLTNCSDGSACTAQISVDRKMMTLAFQGTSPWVVSNGGTFAVQAAQSGTWNIGTLTTLTSITNPVAVTGTFWQATQPVSIAGTVAVSGPLTDTQLRASPVPVSLASAPTTAVTIADGADVTLGAKADAKSTATDTTPITIMQALKEISAMEQAPASRAVTNAGTFAVQATLAAETTKVIGTVNQGTSPWVTSFSAPQHVINDASSAVIGHVITDTGSTTAVTGTVTVSGSVTANAGTNLNTSLLQLDATGAALNLAQGSTTSGQTGPLVQTATTTSAPTYVTAKTNPLSTDTAGNLRVTNTTALAAGSNVIGHVINDASSAVIGHVIADSGSTTAVTGNVTVVQGTGTNLHAVLDTTSTTAVTQATAANLNATVVGTGTFATQATLAAETTKVIGTTRIIGNAGAVLDAATGAAPPANAMLNAGLGSGATGGLLVGTAVGDTYKNINISTATTTLLITGVSGRQVRISAIHMIAGAADNVALIEGTGATCGTGTAGMAGGTTAASGYNLAANGGFTIGSGVGTVIQTATTGDSVCAVTSAATQLSGGIEYAIY